VTPVTTLDPNKPSADAVQWRNRQQQAKGNQKPKASEHLQKLADGQN